MYNSNSLSIFVITDINQVYGCGYNARYQLGIGHKIDQENPVLIPELCNQNVIDIQCAFNFSIALCSTSKAVMLHILQFWLRKECKNIDIPDEIINLINEYFKVNKVLSTGEPFDGGHGHYEQIVKHWKEIEHFRDKEIIKIRVGRRSSMFLDKNGTVWCCGENTKVSWIGHSMGLAMKFVKLIILLKII